MPRQNKSFGEERTEIKIGHCTSHLNSYSVNYCKLTFIFTHVVSMYPIVLVWQVILPAILSKRTHFTLASEQNYSVCRVNDASYSNFLGYFLLKQ